MTIYLPELDSYSLAFPPANDALSDPNGLLAMGGDLRPERLVAAYNQGIFPWYSPHEPILWWSPSPRAVLLPREFRPSRSLKRYFRKFGYRVSINKATKEVIRLCADLRPEEETWIGADMLAAYQVLSELGKCHSVEVWDADELIGGMYGIAVGGIFCGESMFSKKSNASKIALWKFCEHFTACGGELLDCQVLNPHTESLGAFEISRQDYLVHLEKLKNKSISPDCFNTQWLTDTEEK
ncbi:leucyl/phenylalanyl-tRNA--protein transferase [Vibrio hannami]|uniref:leucyl/phenylalanyl-tRNA--protein transferase n=1 Tax=Vibrio hannami TaxID=2717094 RepID=UPI00240EAE1B|nr:leucyl/phenylalanyl-tRNA--protein transferase [Vibrio hannami]MDG3088377.1 leucyl/phenylalanyl-tRNA--protein transferase [Vibrio hannami]